MDKLSAYDWALITFVAWSLLCLMPAVLVACWMFLFALCRKDLS